MIVARGIHQGGMQVGYAGTPSQAVHQQKQDVEGAVLAQRWNFERAEEETQKAIKRMMGTTSNV